MKKFNKLVSTAAMITTLSFIGCSSSEPQYVVQETKPLGGQNDSIQKQTESKPQSQYSNEDWFYDYYDLTEEEKEKLKNK